jgi:hypothetical protein
LLRRFHRNTPRPVAPVKALRDVDAESKFLAIASLIAAPAALADEAISYDPSGGNDFIKNVSGVAYIGLVGFFVYRLFKKRAKTATGERIASVPSPPQARKVHGAGRTARAIP